MTEQTLTAPIDDRQELSRGFSRYQSILVALLALVQFTIIIDFMIMSPLGAIIMPALDISAAQFGVAVSAYAFSAGISGILAAGTRSGAAATFNYETAPQAVVDKVAAIETVCEEHGVPLAAAALQFPLAHPLVASVIPGLDSPQRVEQALALYRYVIPAAFWSELKAQGFLHKDAPVPA